MNRSVKWYHVCGGWNTFWDSEVEDIYREHAMTAETVPGCREVEA